MAFLGTQVAMTASSQVTVASAVGYGGPTDVFVKFYTTGPAYLGSSDVSSSGFALSTADHQPFSVRIMPGEVLYGYSTAGVTLSVLKHHDW
jgi:hypothetical protein